MENTIPNINRHEHGTSVLFGSVSSSVSPLDSLGSTDTPGPKIIEGNMTDKGW